MYCLCLVIPWRQHDAMGLALVPTTWGCMIGITIHFYINGILYSVFHFFLDRGLNIAYTLGHALRLHTLFIFLYGRAPHDYESHPLAWPGLGGPLRGYSFNEPGHWYPAYIDLLPTYLPYLPELEIGSGPLKQPPVKLWRPLEYKLLTLQVSFLVAICPVWKSNLLQYEA